jgi:hypothetical protein
MSYAAFHWRVYNILRRVIAMMTLIVGAAFVGDRSGCAHAVGIMGAGPPRSILASTATLLRGLALVALGVRLCRLRTYRPDLGDTSWWAGKSGVHVSGATRSGPPRVWLTGDPRS